MRCTNIIWQNASILWRGATFVKKGLSSDSFMFSFDLLVNKLRMLPSNIIIVGIYNNPTEKALAK